MGGLPSLFTSPSSYPGDSLGLNLMHCIFKVQTLGPPDWCMAEEKAGEGLLLVLAGGEQVMFLNPPFVKGLLTKEKIEIVLLCFTLDN